MRYFLILALFLVACQQAANPALNIVEETAVPPRPILSPAQISLGETVYAQQCASCHGVNLEGQPEWKSQNEDGSFRAPPHDESGHTWHHGDPTLLEAIYAGGARLADMNVGGTSDMPIYGDILSDAEIMAVLTYIKSTWPDDIQAIQWEATLREELQNEQ
jgi:mono/diheme cytochrome c family protein